MTLESKRDKDIAWNTHFIGMLEKKVAWWGNVQGKLGSDEYRIEEKRAWGKTEKGKGGGGGVIITTIDVFVNVVCG